MAEFGFESLRIYKTANELGKTIWDMVSKWNWFEKDTLGKQIVRSADSVSQNICEGYGRFYNNDKKRFYYYSRGSLYETYESIKKARERNLLSEEEYIILKKTILDFAVRLNNYIKTIKAPVEKEINQTEIEQTTAIKSTTESPSVKSTEFASQ
jgi:four helix bundle protein